MTQQPLQYIMQNQKRGLWIFFTILFFICSTSQALPSTQTSITLSPLSLLREELVGTIKDLHNTGFTDLEDSMTELVSQLESLQSVPGSPLHLEWEQAGLNSTVAKNICFVVSSFEGLYINSGIGTTYYALAELLARGGNKVTVLYTRDQPPATGSFNDWVKHYEEKNIQLKSLPHSDKRIANPKLQVISAQVYQYLKNNQYDIVHFADFEGLGFYSTMAKRVGLDFSSTLFVTGLHGPTRWVLDANEGRIPSHESELEVDYMERYSVENSDVLWTPSNFLASWLSVQGWNISSSDVHLLPLPPGPEVRVKRENVHIKAKELVFFGRLETRKGLSLFCDAVDLLNNMFHKHLTITFLGTNGFVNGRDSVEYIRSRSSKWSFNTKVITNATREAALQYLTERKAGRIPVMPSLIDNAPYTVYECLYSGIPFLASSTPSITPLLVKADNHLFETKPHQLASKMIHAIKNGLSSAKSLFSSSKAEDSWVSFYSQINKVALSAPSSFSLSNDELPLVSVCLTHYNRPNFVKQAIESINSQEYKKIEVILVDDGSNSTEALSYLDSIQASFDKNGWKIIRTANRYLGAARNTAAKEASGKYLLFLDDDNVAFPHQISTYVSVAEKTNADVITAGHAVFKGVDSPTFESIDRFWLPLGPSLTVGLFKNCFGDANFFVSRESFQSIGGFTEEHSVGLEEHEFFAKAVFAGFKLEVIPEPLLYYRMHNEQDQMVFSLDPRMGEARRMRPYLEALDKKSNNNEEKTMRTRRSLVQLVARNAMDNTQDCNQTLSSVTPANGPINGGTTITVRGVGFTCGVQALRVDGQECTGLHVVSNYEITCQTPAGSKTYTPVDVTADVGGATVAVYSAFTYLPLSAPSLGSCRLSNDGVTVNCNFSSITDQSAGSCSSFFDAATVSSFGSGANCYWTSQSVLSIDLGQGATIAVGSSINLLAGSVKAAGSTDIVNQAGSTTLLAPLSASSPIASISSPSSVGSCEGITLSGASSTGGLGRSLTFVWALVSIEPASSDAVTAINSIISEANLGNSASVSISADKVLEGSSYSFSLVVTNWINGNASTTSTIKKVSASVPTVSISGSSVVEMLKNAPLSLTGSVNSSCGGQLGSLTYSWTITPTVSLGSSSLSSVSLTVPENTFTAGTTYTVTFKASDSNGLENSASVTVSVGVRPLVVSISGGNKQYQNTETVTLDGSASSDPEGLEGFSFSWSCVSFYDAKNPCNVNAPSSSVFSFDASTLGVGKFTVTLTVSGAKDRTATATAWIEVLEISVLSVAIQQLAEDPVNPSTSLTLTGVLTQAGVSQAEVSWSWSLIGGNLANPSSAYLSGLDAMILVIAPNALTAGTTYTYKLTATQTATGVTGSATISFGVFKAPTTGEFGCAVTSGNAEDTVFNYDFGAMWGSTSGIVSYEIRFVPEGSSLEIPLGEPSATTTFSTKLPYGKHTIVGIAVSGNGVAARKYCSADVTYADASAGLQSLASSASSSGLSAFDVARIAYGAKNAFAKVGSSGSNTFASIRSSLVSALPGASSVATATANTASLLVITDPSLAILSQSVLVSSISSFGSLLDAQASLALNSTVLAADVEILSNLVDQLSSQDFDVRVVVKRDTTADQDLWNAFQDLITISGKVSAQYLSTVSNGQSQITIAKSLVTLNLYLASTSLLTGNGVSMGSQSTVKLPSGFVPSGISADNLALALSSWGVSPYPSSASIISPVLILSVTASGSRVALDSLPSPATVFVPSGELLDDSNLECVTWSTANSSWSADGCTTSASKSGVTCQCESAATAFAISKNANSRATVGDDNKSGGLSSTIIGVIAGVGGVALLAAVVVGSVIGVRRHRANQAGAPAAATTTAAVPAASSDISPSSSDSVAVPVASGSAAPDTPASSYGSYSSSASSRSIVSSSSSEEEVMEQQIRDIVGELSTALPRDPRALEVLGDRLDME